jgi:uncharacterized Tic20 family protein
VSDRYGSDVLSGDWKVPPKGRSREVEAETGLVVEEVVTGWCGAVVRVEKAGGMRVVHLEDRRGRTKGFPMGPGFLLDGAPVILTPPTAAARAKIAEAKAVASRTASGSRAVEGAKARVASGSRIFVEGRHDAELVEKVWGADLRVEGVVVELLDGVDDLVAAIAMVVSAGTLGFVASLVIYLVYRDRVPFVRAHAANAVNVQLTALIGLIVSGVLMIVLVGFVTYPLVVIAAVVIHVIAAMRANAGEWYDPPFTIRFVK